MRPVIILVITACSWKMCAGQDSIPRLNWRYYKETVVVFGYNYTFGSEEGKPGPKGVHYLEAGVWRTHASFGHHPVFATYYAASDFSLNADKFTIAPKIGGFVGIMVLGTGLELIYYTSFDEGALRLHWQMFGYFTPYFKLAVGILAPLTSKEFKTANLMMVNLTVRAFKIKRTDL